MAEVTRKNIIFTPIVKSATTITEETIDKEIIDEIFPEVDDNERVGCVDINALNLCSDCVGCYNENKIPVRSNTSCCEYEKFKCILGADSRLCVENGTYVGGFPNLTTAIFNDTLCNSGQTCCEFFCDGEYRGDYDFDSELGVCSDYNPDKIKTGQIGTNGSYDTLKAFQNAITDGIMCNCFSSKPEISPLFKYGQTQKRILYNLEEWPEKTVEDDKNSYVQITENITNHPPNIYVYFNICGYPKNINAFRKPNAQILESNSGIINNTYNNLYGETPKKIMEENTDVFTIPNDVPKNKNEFNDGLKVGENIITITCANNKQIIYKVCIPHQTVPYEKTLWKTEYFNCDVDNTK
tara:strand:+ start:2651 stop:3709 length:1059 start_codon:yes stop_codon:yes gene_type:complete